MSGVLLTPEQQAVLYCVATIAERPAMKLTCRDEPGNIVWINNLAVMHRRDRYVDHPDPAKARLLHWMWSNRRGDHLALPEHAAFRSGIRGPAATMGVG